MGDEFGLLMVPKESGSVSTFMKEISSSNFESQVSKTLEKMRISPTKISLSAYDKGLGKKGTSLEGFKFIKYSVKLRGKKKSFLRTVPWKSDSELTILVGTGDNKRDGVMLSSTRGRVSDMRLIFGSLVDRVAELMGGEGVLHWSQSTKTGSLAQ
jgi:hypothetical protein